MKIQLSGMVVEGKKVGRTLGFPTINIAGTFDLEYGVYASMVHARNCVYRGALHYGPRLFMGILRPTLEVHLLDFSGDLYGENVLVDVYNKIRDGKSFPDHDALKRQITSDVEAVRAFSFPDYYDQIPQE